VRTCSNVTAKECRSGTLHDLLRGRSAQEGCGEVGGAAQIGAPLKQTHRSDRHQPTPGIDDRRVVPT